MASQRVAPSSIISGLNRSGSDIAAYRFVIADVDQEADAIEVAADGSAPILGITFEAIADTYNGDVVDQGKMKLTLGDDTLTKGMLLTADASGRGVEAAAGEYVGAILLEDGDTGDVREVRIVSFQADTAP